MYLPKSHFFKNSLAGASGLVLMSDPVSHMPQGGSNRGSYERQRAVGGNALDHTAIRAGSMKLEGC